MAWVGVTVELGWVWFGLGWVGLVRVGSGLGLGFGGVGEGMGGWRVVGWVRVGARGL